MPLRTGATVAGVNQVTNFRTRMRVAQKGLMAGLLALVAFALLPVTSTGQTATTYMLYAIVTGPGILTASSPGPYYTAGSTVTLTAIPVAGGTFSGWFGAEGCSTAVTCTVT